MQLAIPQEWQDVLKQVQAVFPSAIIAGGALRDLMHGKPIKDVDIFVPIHLDYVGSLEAAYERVWDMFSGENIILDEASQYGVTTLEDKDRDLYAIFKLIRRMYGPVIDGQCYAYDLVLCTPDAARIETFDINLCQITYDGKHVRITGAYATGYLTRTLRVMNVNRTDRNAARMQRMCIKYPDFTVEDYDVK